MPEQQQEVIFKELLSMNAVEANQYLRSMPNLQPIFA
jgi:hypothetical protein